MQPIYLDHNATTPLDGRVLETMLPYLKERFGNASSINHRLGWEAAQAVEKAREQAATVISAQPKEIVWTSGATESCNLAIKGIARRYREKGRHIITQVTEHRAVLDSCEDLENQGFRVTRLAVDRHGRINLDELRGAMSDDTILVSIMTANNEIGTLQPIHEVGRLCKQRQVLFHCDATQGYGKMPMDVDEMGIDLLSASAHKIYGPKGTGILYVRRHQPRVQCDPIIRGGGHEEGLRSGTLNVPGIVGFGEASRICLEEMSAEAVRLRRLRDRFVIALRENADVVVHGHPVDCLANTANISFPKVDSEQLLKSCPAIAASSGTACSTAKPGPSHVLSALGISTDLIYNSVRFSLGRSNNEEQIDSAVDAVLEALTKGTDPGVRPLSRGRPA